MPRIGLPFPPGFKITTEACTYLPKDAQEQLWGAVEAVFKSWQKERAILYRQKYGISAEWGTVVNVQAMVFVNMGDPASIEFFQSLGLNYVSYSPPRVPVARLTAAQSAIQKRLRFTILKALPIGGAFFVRSIAGKTKLVHDLSKSLDFIHSLCILRSLIC